MEGEGGAVIWRNAGRKDGGRDIKRLTPNYSRNVHHFIFIVVIIIIIIIIIYQLFFECLLSGQRL